MFFFCIVAFPSMIHYFTYATWLGVKYHFERQGVILTEGMTKGMTNAFLYDFAGGAFVFVAFMIIDLIPTLLREREASKSAS
jgi:hypothetical protein